MFNDCLQIPIYHDGAELRLKTTVRSDNGHSSRTDKEGHDIDKMGYIPLVPVQTTSGI